MPSVLAVCHILRNNLDADFSRELEANGLGLATSAATARNATSAPLYANILVALADTQPYRPQTILANAGEAAALPLLSACETFDLYQKPKVSGVQTAIVVGVDGSPTDTDRNHRVKLQFHWQRGRMSHSRLGHASGDNAPANEAASTWVRVGTPLAGDNYGSNFIPRLGQEVIVGLTHGDIDRPVIVGAIYNGESAANQTGNTQPGGVGAATGNAPLWFNGNGHANHLSGIVTQTLSDSQSGAAQRYSQLVLDDTPQQSRLQLGHHQHQGKIKSDSARTRSVGRRNEN